MSFGIEGNFRPKRVQRLDRVALLITAMVAMSQISGNGYILHLGISIA